MLRRALMLVAVTPALSLASTASIAAGGQRPTYKHCPQHHLRAHDPRGLSLAVTNLRASRMRCARAAAAVRASTFAATPAGPMFSTAGFKCGGPVGPPMPGSEPRYYHCGHGHKRFEFLVPGFS